MIKKALSIILIIFLISNQVAFGRSYPFKKVSKSSCRFTDWSEHSDDCKMDIPMIENADYDKYKDNKTYRLLYTVLWTATYDNGWDIGYGSHLGVDIATAKGTPVYAIGDGTVYAAKYFNGWGNAVVIAHKVDGKTIYSVYAHLNSINTTQGSSVKEGDKIGEVGHSGNSYGNHLHFQIDINQTGFHPYYHNDCDTSESITNIVNKGICQNYVTTNTIDPIYFIETSGIKIIEADTQEEITKIAEEVKEQETIEPTEIVSRQEFLKTELDTFLSKYEIDISSSIEGNTLKVGNTGELKLEMYNKKNQKPFDDILMEKIKVEYDTGVLSISPEGIQLIEDGKRTITVKAKRLGTTTVNFKIFDRIIQSFTIRVIDDNTEIEAENAFVYTLGTPYVGGEYYGIAVLKDSAYQNIINVPYDGTFTLKTNGNSLLCPIYISSQKDISKLSSRSCNTPSLKNTTTFDYSKTLKGLFIFKVIPKTEGKLELSVYKGNTKIGNNISRQIYFPVISIQFDKYKEYIQKALQNLYVRNLFEDDFGSEYSLKESDAIYWINNSFADSKTKIGSKFKYLTRFEFIKLVSDLTSIKSTKKKIFSDISTTDSVYTNILIDYDAKFLDDFGEKYFQPDLKITRKEAAYILYKIKTKK